MKLSMTGQEKGDLLMQVTAWAGLTIYIYRVDVVEWSRALDVRLSEWCLQCINGVGSNPVEGRTKI